MSTALVLGGGGPVGMAWEYGLLSGVAQSGADLKYIDLTVATSAGSAVGAWFLSGGFTDADVVGRLEALGGEYLDLITKLMAAAPQTSGGQTAARTALTDAMDHVAEPGTDRAASNRTIGRLDLEAPAIPEAAYVSLFERLVGTQWPSAFVCASTDVDSGELQTWDHRSGVPLALAVAASCAWPGAFPTVTVGVLVDPDSRFLAISEHGAALMDLSRVRAANAAGVELGAKVAERFAPGQAV